MKRRPWSEAEQQTLRARYADACAQDIADALGRSISGVYQQARAMGLRKSPTFWMSEQSGRIRRQTPAAVAARFKPGQVPHNKGLRRPGWAPGRMRETQFKPGRPPQLARNYRPVGSLRMSKDGYVERKVTDDHPVPARRWVAVHRLAWEAAHGPIPQGHIVVFRARARVPIVDAHAIRAEDLELITRVENMRRNSYHRYPQPIPQLVQLRGAITRQINQRQRAET